MKINGIAERIVDKLVNRGNQLGQGRSVGTIGLLGESGYIENCGQIVDGGLSGLPFRKLLSEYCGDGYYSLLEMINRLPENAVIISTDPGQTGIIVSTGGINIFNLPMVKIGVKGGRTVGVGILYPEKKFFNLASQSEKAQLDSLAALNMEEERKALRSTAEVRLKHLNISEELPVVKTETDCLQTEEIKIDSGRGEDWSLPRIKVKSMAEAFARNLVARSLEIEQGREVAAFGIVDSEGHVQQAGEIVEGGMGYIPSRLLISGYQDISDMSLREAYTDLIPPNAVIVHTHPGGTGVMHMSDAMAGPGAWGRPIIAIGHNEKGEIKGATVIEFTEKICQLADENEELEQKFFMVNTSEEEMIIRKRRYEIAQEFTALSKDIKIS